jgi:glycerol transport system permease protein
VKTNWVKAVGLALYFAFLLVPLYWMVNCSFRSTTEILTERAWYPRQPTTANYAKILGSPDWRRSFVNSLGYVSINVVLVLAAAVPAAYAFSRWRFRGDKHLFFWLLTNRMAPGAIFVIPMVQLYTNLKLHDTLWAVALAHCLFNLPLAVWILEGFMGGIPKELDETAFVDGMSFGRFFVKIFLPLIRPGIGVTAFFCFLFSWTELLLASTLTVTDVKPLVVTMTRSQAAEGWDWGVLTAVGVLTMVPGTVMVYFIRNYIAKGFAMGRV